MNHWFKFLTRGKRSYAVAVCLTITLLLAIALYQKPVRPNQMALMPQPSATVVLITLDGARPQELLRGADITLSKGQAAKVVMKNFMTNLVRHGVFLGDASKGSRVRIGNPMGISMSGYQAIFSGQFKLCVSNQCSPLSGETLLTRVTEAFGPTAILLSAYGEVCKGIAAAASTKIAVCGHVNLKEHAIALGLTAYGSSDGIVIDAGLEHLRRDPPELLYLGLEESDGVAHSGDYPKYISVLERYDGYLKLIWAEIEKLNAAGHPTTLLVTVDHGRGNGVNWTKHRWNIRGSGEIWMFGAGHGVAPKGVLENTKTRSLYDVRPTVEYLLGLRPKTRFRGDIIEEFF